MFLEGTQELSSSDLQNRLRIKEVIMDIAVGFPCSVFIEIVAATGTPGLKPKCNGKLEDEEEKSPALLLREQLRTHQYGL
ncbi:hypothetical protein L1987_09813 [Smallanthus sonchifolius]|uniref:Uncharacterized protein n=1 Tax=Smallanthus sonchifolius TaxID=185202 RepID=A0ACB9JQD2_9ASTR|nr:hypothetical protein L1987_09813 [Smallanthus sonchifolius]